MAGSQSFRRGGELRIEARRAHPETTFTYRKGSFDAPQKSMHPFDRVEKDGNGALWAFSSSGRSRPSM